MVKLASKAGLVFVACSIDTLGRYTVMIAAILTALVWAGSSIIYTPYYSARMNKVQASLSGVFLWGCCMLLLGLLRDQPEDDVAGFVFFMALPFVGFVASSLTDIHDRWAVGWKDWSNVLQVCAPGRRLGDLY